MGLITDTLLTYLPGKRKTTPSGWISFNAPCCDDKRQRGGFIINDGDGMSYHCFNCGFKCSWQPGRTLSKNLRKFMRDLNMPDDTISKLSLEALRSSEDPERQTIQSIIPKFDKRALPLDAILIEEALPKGDEACDPKLLLILKYLSNRKLYLEDYPFYWTPRIGFNNRVIIPFFYKNEVVGYTARAIGDVTPRYISEQQPGYVFNLDNQHDDRKFAIVVEGPVDAISIDGCALMGSEIKDSQNWLLKQLGRELILVPDRDHEGPKLVEQAIELGYSVSMPEWPHDPSWDKPIKDVNDAVVKLGRLATLHLILQAKESYPLKIQLRAKKWFREV
jgi:hypothetical protein